MKQNILRGRSINLYCGSKAKPTRIPDPQNVETCKNCTAPKCRGYCDKIKGVTK